MITRKSSSKAHTLLPKALTIEIPFKDHLLPTKTSRQTHKIRKSHHRHSPKMVKIENALDSLELDFLSNSRIEAAAWNVLTSPNQKQASSYLTYKREQVLLKAMHTNKTILLKNKLLHTRQSPEAKEKSSTSTRLTKIRHSVEPQRKLSFITLGGFKENNQQKYNLHEGRDRQIYIKTAEGRRQKIYESEYFSKMQQKSHRLTAGYSIQLSPPTQGCESRISPSTQKTSRNERLSLLRHIRTRNLRRERKQLKPDDCRPWSSSKSDFIEA